MARSKTDLTPFNEGTDFDNLPDGITIAKVARTVGTKPKRNKGESDDDYAARCDADKNYVRNAILSVLKVTPNGKGVTAITRWLSENAPEVEINGKAQPYGPAFVAEAINAALLNHVPRLEPSDVDNALSFVPPIQSPRYVDPMEAFNSALAGFHREHSRFPTPEEYQELRGRFEA